jgi:uncharacterized protein (DUF305 family)
MNINYKITTIILLAILVITLAFRWNALFPQHSMNQKGMDMQSSMGTMHKMPDGSMMSNDGMNNSMDMNSMMMDMTAGMNGKTGTGLEKVFLQEMIVHHKGAVDMATLLLQDKTIKPELQDFANKIISAQNPEIDQMKSWLKSY